MTKDPPFRRFAPSCLGNLLSPSSRHRPRIQPPWRSLEQGRFVRPSSPAGWGRASQELQPKPPSPAGKRRSLLPHASSEQPGHGFVGLVVGFFGGRGLPVRSLPSFGPFREGASCVCVPQRESAFLPAPNQSYGSTSAFIIPLL